MYSLKMLLRRSGRTLCGILLIAMAVAVLVVTMGQSLAAYQTMQQVEYDFTTLALYTGQYDREDAIFDGKKSGNLMLEGMNPELQAWIDQVVAENPQWVEGYSRTGLASAYLPELVPDHYSSYASTLEGVGKVEIPWLRPESRYTMNQDTAAFVVRLEEVGVAVEDHNGQMGHYSMDRCIIKLQCVIEQVLCLSETQKDPTGWPIEITWEAASQEEIDAMALEVGKRYVVGGIDYLDRSIDLGRWINMQVEIQSLSLPRFDESLLHFTTEQDKEDFEINHQWIPVAVYGNQDVIWEGQPRRISPYFEQPVLDNNIALTYMGNEEYLKYYQTAKMTAVSVASLTMKEFVDGQLREITQFPATVDGKDTRVSREEYAALYATPTIAPLEGSVEEFLAQNPEWAQWLECAKVNMHAFPVFTVEKMDHIPEFNRGMAKVTQGREFTRQELERGAKVCLISELVAQKSGLKVGDTIKPQFYDYDLNLPYTCLPGDYLEECDFVGEVLTNPAYFHKGSSFVQEVEEYTIVGLYRQANVWEDYEDNNYGFTPNTIFVPDKAVNAPVYYGDEGLFRVLVLKNGCYQEFDDLVMSKTLESLTFDGVIETAPDVFSYTDQGYTTIRGSVMDYQTLAQRVVLVGLAVYGVILALFLLLYPGMQGKTLRTMASLGTPREKRWAHVMVSALGILVPGTVLGAVLGYGLWGTVVSRLLTATAARFSLALRPGHLVLIALGQLAVAAVAACLLAIPLARRENLMGRK